MPEIDTNLTDSFVVAHLGAKGDGVTQEGFFATGTLPGEHIQGDLIDDRIARPKILTPSVERVKPPCRHATSCGGCSLQHASDGFVSRWKRDVVLAALSRFGIQTEIKDTITSPPNSRRRAAMSGRRTKSGALVGFHGRESDQIRQIDDCKVLTPKLIALLEVLEQITILGASRRAELTFHVVEALDGVDVLVEGGSKLDPHLIQKLAEIAERAHLTRLSWGQDTVALRETSFVAMGRARTPVPPGAFLQATVAGQDALVGAVSSALGAATQVIDLFAGAGTFSLPMAEVAEVHAVEGERELLAALDQGWRGSTGLKAVSVETRDLFRNPYLSNELSKYDGIIIDPPRAGAKDQCAEIAKSDVSALAYVSCNPATFARDAKELVSAGFQLDWVQPVDQFRWSSHVELASQFSR